MKKTKEAKKMTKRLNERVVANSYGLPNEGEEFCGQPVLASGVDLEKGRWFIITDGTIQKTQASPALRSVLGRTKFFTARNKVYELNAGKKYAIESISTNPPGSVQTVIGGSITSKRVRQNPVSVQEFRSEMTGMVVGDPRRDFREYDSPKLHSAAFRDQLYTFVSYRGESYGWVKGGKIYHRRGSLIMPKLKVNKAVEGATVFYHTHPSRDEPSLSSADDYQFYCDLAYGFGIKEFYTIMENRIDHFTFTVKKSKEEDYLKLDEDKFLDDINAIIDDAEARVTKKHKTNKNMSDETFNATITKGVVSDINKRFSDFVNIKYKGHTRPGIVRDNPGVAGFLRNPPIRISHRHTASQLDELRDTTNNFEHYGANEFGHSKYVYWWVDHYFSQSNAHPKGRLWKLKDYGVGDETRRKLRAYLSEELAPGYSNLDLLMFLALYHDVGKKREKEQGRHHSIIAAEMFRDEISHELKLPQQVTDAFYMLMMTDCGRKNISLEGFITQAGDHLGVAYLLQVADMLAHHPFMFTTIAKEAKDSGFIDKANVDSYKQKAAEQHFDNIRKFLNNRVKGNPPPSIKAVYYEGDYGVPIDGDYAQEALEEYSGQTVPMVGSALAKNFFYNGQLFCRYPMTDDDSIGVVLYLNRGHSSIKMQSRYVTEDDPFGQKLANKIHREIGEKLAEVNPYEIVLDDPEPAVLVNPRHAKNIHLITITSEDMKLNSAVKRHLAGVLPDAEEIPTTTTRQGRGNVVSEKQFLEMIENGEFAQWRKAKSGFYVGRRFADFKKPTAVLSTTIESVKQLSTVFPNATHLFLELSNKPTELSEKAHSIGLDIVRVRQGEQHTDIAERIADDIVKQNPPPFEFSRDPVKRKKRWELITTSPPDKLRKMAYDMAKEAGVRIEIQQEQLPPLKMKNVPKSIADEIEKWYYSSVDRVSFWMGRKSQIAILERKVVHRPVPKTVKDWILNYSTKHKSKEKAPSISGFILFRYNPRRSDMSAGYDGRWTGLSHWRSGKERKIPAKAFPLMYDAGGGYVEEERQFQGYYGIIKTLEASYLEKHGIEGYGMGSSLQRAEYYRSFGWLMPQDVSKYAPYVHGGPRSYLLLDEGDVLGWDSSMEYLWRPVYSKPKKNPPVMLKARGTDDLLSRFINPETGEELTGRWFDGGVIDTSQGPRPFSELGDEITDVDMIANLDGPRHTFNVGKWGDRTIIQGYRQGRYYEKVEIKTPVFLLSNPTEIGEPSAYFATRGIIQIEDSEDYEVVKPGEITDFQGNAKGFRPDMVFKSAVVVSRAEAETDKLWPNPRLKPTVVLSKSDNPKKKFVAVFTYSDGRTKTTHFGAKGMSDYTIHKDEKRMKRYLNRHRKNENWNDYTSAGSLSRWVLWNKPSLRASWNDYLDRFGLEGTMRRNPMAPGYQSYGWTTQDWRSIKVNNKGDIDYSEKCGAEGTKTPSGSPRLCLPKKVIQTLMRTESGKEILREQARKKARAKKGERVPWHPRIKKLHGKLEKKTPKDRKKKKSRSIFTNPQTGLPGLGTPPVDPATLDPHLDWPKWVPPSWFDKNTIPQDAVWIEPIKVGKHTREGYYHIRQTDLTTLLQSQAYLDAQEADRQRKMREAQATKERLIREGQKFVDDFRTNPMSLACREHGVVPPHEIGQNNVGSLIHTVCGRDLKAMRTDEQGNIVGRRNVPLYESSRRAIPTPMYHGTSKRRLDEIRAAGQLEPRHSAFMGEGVYLTADPQLARKYAQRASMYPQEERVIVVDVGSLERDNKHLVMRLSKAKHTSVSDEPADIYTVDSPIPLRYFVKIWGPDGEVPKMVMVNPPSIIATGAPHKIAEYKEQLGEGFTFNDKYDLPEVEADPKTVALYKSKLGYEVMGKPVLVEDTTLHIEGMSANDASKIKFIVKNLDQYIGRTAVERVYIGYSDGEKVYLYLGETKGRLLSPRGDKGFGYDLYFAPEGSDKTYAERKVTSSRTKAIKKMLADEPDYVGPVPPEWQGEWQAGYSPVEGIRENPPLDYPDDLAEAFEMMKRQAKKNRELEMTEGFDAYGWWKFEQKDAIDAKYGKAVVPGASWKLPVFDPDFDPHIPDKQPQPNYENDFHPLKPGQKEPDVKNHFYNQLMRIPQTSPPTPRKILQIALNIGQGHATGTVTEDYSIDDFIEVSA